MNKENITGTGNIDVLIGTWLRGECLDDLRLVEPSDFPEEFQLIVKHLKKGLNVLEIVKALPGMAGKIAKLSMAQSDVLYRLELADVIEGRTKKHLGEWSLSEIYNNLEAARLAREDVMAPEGSPSELVLKEMERRSSEKRIPFRGMPKLTWLTEGLHAGELTIIAGRPGDGKSAFGLQVAYGAFDSGEKVLYFPLEVGAEQTAERLLIQEQYVPAYAMKHNDIKDHRRLQLGLELLDFMAGSGKWQVYPHARHIEEIEAIVHKEHPGVIVIDQLSWLETRRNFQTVREEYKHYTRTLKKLAVDAGCAVVLCVQLNRGSGEAEPTERNLKESGSIEEDGNNVILLYKLNRDWVSDPDKIDWSEGVPCIAHLIKQTTGQVGKIKCMFSFSKLKFYEVAEEK